MEKGKWFTESTSMAGVQQEKPLAQELPLQVQGPSARSPFSRLAVTTMISRSVAFTLCSSVAPLLARSCVAVLIEGPEWVWPAWAKAVTGNSWTAIMTIAIQITFANCCLEIMGAV
jgi:hypothetical protein